MGCQYVERWGRYLPGARVVRIEGWSAASKPINLVVMKARKDAFAWSVTIPAVKYGTGASAILAWALVLLAAIWFGSKPGGFSADAFMAMAIVGALFLLAVFASVNAYYVGQGLRGQLVLDADGFTVRGGWRRDTRYVWHDAVDFASMVVSPNDGMSRTLVGFYRRKADGGQGAFVAFPETLDMPMDDLIAVLNFVRSLDAAAKEALPRDAQALLAASRR